MCCLGLTVAPTVTELNVSREVSENENSLFDEKNPRFKFNGMQINPQKLP